MKTSENGIHLIKGFEGFSEKPYVCPAGKNTVGYGHVIKKGELCDEVTEAQAETILAGDLIDAEEAVAHLVKVPLTQNQFDALVSFIFNVGVGNFASSTLLKLLNAHDYAGAAGQFIRWIYAGQEALPGLKHRRESETELFKL